MLILDGGCVGAYQNLNSFFNLLWNLNHEWNHILLEYGVRMWVVLTEIFTFQSLLSSHDSHYIWAASWQNQQNDVGPAKTQTGLGIHPVWSESAVHSMGSRGAKASSCGQQRLIRLGRCPGWSESSLAAQVILLVLSCSVSYWSETNSRFASMVIPSILKDFMIIAILTL